MKKLIVLTLVSLASVFSYGQKVATATPEALQKAKTSGVIVFGVPADITAAEVDGVKNYYKQYFTTTLDEKKHEITLTLINNDEMSKQVVNRLMVSLDIRDYKVDGSELSFDEVFEKYLK
jgi:hypothetical protein